MIPSRGLPRSRRALLASGLLLACSSLPMAGQAQTFSRASAGPMATTFHVLLTPERLYSQVRLLAPGLPALSALSLAPVPSVAPAVVLLAAPAVLETERQDASRNSAAGLSPPT